MIHYNEFCKRAEHWLKDGRTVMIPKAVMVLNIESFQLLSLMYGSARGREILRRAGAVLERRIGRRGLVSLKFADVFVIVTEHDGVEDLMDICEAIAADLEREIVDEADGFLLRPTIGIYLVTPGEYDMDILQGRAIIARRTIKNRYERHYNFYCDGMEDTAVRRKHMTDDIGRALRRHEFQPYFQPIFDSRTERPVSAEALIRWHMPDGTALSPKDFIPFAEETGIITAIDSYMLEEVCRCQARWLGEGRRPVPVSVNVSRRQLHRSGFVPFCCGVLSRYDVPTELIHLEITEGILSQEPEVSSVAVNRLMALGIHVMMDDFGIGYSSLRMLRRVNLSTLKIDKSFIDDMSDTGREFIKCIIRMARLKGMRTVAEGVETEEQLRFLQGCGCDMLQGYYLERPMSPAAFGEMLLHR